MHTVGSGAKLRLRDMRPSRAELKQAFMPMLRGTLVGTLFGAMPGTGPTITTFIAYAVERKIAKDPSRFGQGALEGVAAPEAASHSKTQVDFIPTMSLGIPGDAVMALLLGALLIQGIQPGPALISEHPDIFWGLIASFWVGNVLLMVLNVPMIGIWVKLLQVPYKYLFPSALFFIAAGVYSTNNSLFEVGEVLFFGIVGAVFLALDFPGRADPAGLRARAAGRGELPARPAALARRPARLLRAPDRVHVHGRLHPAARLQIFFGIRTGLGKRRALRPATLAEAPALEND